MMTTCCYMTNLVVKTNPVFDKFQVSLEVKQKIEAFMLDQAGATDKIVNHSFITNTLTQK